ncbi:MAG TPA: SLC13 family permease [Burkholderiales bacterium]|nr:SLC13 family permease [Burkholderiales bacterium]
MLKPLPILTAIVVAAAVAVYFMPPPAGVSVETMHAAALVVLVIGLWALAAVPEYIVALLFFALAMLLAIAPAQVVFSGFASGTLWLVLGGLVTAEAVRCTGLGERFAYFLVARVELSYRGLIVAAVIVSSALCFVMPATIGRVLLLMPIMSALAERVGLERGSSGYNGVALAVMMASYQVGTAVLPSNAPNLVLAGAAETLYGISLTYAEYLLVQFPVMGVAKALVIIALICWLFPDETRRDTGRAVQRPMTGEERRLTVILIAALALWATDFMHHVHPGWIGLAAGVLALLPRIGAMPMTAFAQNVSFGPFFYIAAVLGVGGLMSGAGVSAMLGEAAQSALQLKPGQDALNFGVLTLLATFAGVLVTNPAQPALMAPLAGHFAEAAGWPLKTALMTTALGFTTLILPFQVPPVMVGVQLAGLKLRSVLRLSVPLMLVSFAILLPLDYAWWRLIGYFG